MTMSQMVSESHQHQPLPMSNGCGRATPNGEIDMEPMDLSASAPLSNGTPTTPTKLSPMDEDDYPPGQLSPGSARRRSTRASALKAQEKIKLKDDITGQPEIPAFGLHNGDMAEEIEEGTAAKKPRLMDGTQLDQYSHSFYIKQEEGEVHEVCDESEISSLNSEETSFLRSNYEKIRTSEPTEEQKHERHDMRRKCEAELRLEEARLNLMKKITSSQLIAAQKALEAKKMTPNIALNTAGGAYKPAMAIPKGHGGKAPAAAPKTNNGVNALTLEQQTEFYNRARAINKPLADRLLQIMKSNGPNAQAEMTQLAQALVTHQNQQAKEQQAAKEALMKEASMSSTANSTPQQTAAKAFAAMTPQQRAANARQAFRVQADKQLSQIAYPKAPNPDLSFIPNPNQSDFCYLVGLDLVVQRVLRDKTANADVTEGPYECEECHTDFTPSWKAIGNADDLHLYCEQCVHDTQKRKIQKDHTTFLRKAFNKVSLQEKEFEKQIAEGKLDAVMAQAAAAQAQAHGASTSQSQPQNLSTKQNGTHTPTVTKSSTPVPTSTPKLPSASTPASSKKTNNANLNNFAQMQQAQMTAMAMALRNNPTMLAAMMSGMTGGMSGIGGGGGANSQAQMAQMMQQVQMYSSMQMMMQQSQQMQQNAQQQQQSRAQSQQNNAAMALLAQAAMQSAQAQGGGRNNSNSSQFNMSSLNSSSSMTPAMIQRLQEQLAAHYKLNGKK